MPDWIDMDSADVGADRPLHAGMLHAVRGNIRQAILESGHRYQAIAHGATNSGTHLFDAIDVWQDLTPKWGWWPVQVRLCEDGSLRQIILIVSGLCSVAATVMTVRFYALVGGFSFVTLDPTDALIGETAYAETTYTDNVAWTQRDVTITLTNTRRRGDEAATEDSTVPDTSYEEVCIYAVGQCDIINKSLSLRPPMFEEVP